MRHFTVDAKLREYRIVFNVSVPTSIHDPVYNFDQMFAKHCFASGG